MGISLLLGWFSPLNAASRFRGWRENLGVVVRACTVSPLPFLFGSKACSKRKGNKNDDGCCTFIAGRLRGDKKGRTLLPPDLGGKASFDCSKKSVEQNFALGGFIADNTGEWVQGVGKKSCSCRRPTDRPAPGPR